MRGENGKWVVVPHIPEPMVEVPLMLAQEIYHWLNVSGAPSGIKEPLYLCGPTCAEDPAMSICQEVHNTPEGWEATE